MLGSLEAFGNPVGLLRGMGQVNIFLRLAFSSRNGSPFSLFSSKQTRSYDPFFRIETITKTKPKTLILIGDIWCFLVLLFGTKTSTKVIQGS